MGPKGVIIGAIGGVLGMLAMDIVKVIEFAFAKLPLTTYLMLIGSVFGGGILTGLITHLVFGSVFGALSCVVIIKINTLQISYKNCALLAIVLSLFRSKTSADCEYKYSIS